MSFFTYFRQGSLRLTGGCLFIGLLGMALAMTSLGYELEKETGLSWLFKLRGAQAVPEQVVIVAIDRQSAIELNVPYDPRHWPRSLPAKLINQLAKSGATVIGLDVFFRDQTNEREDRQLATAIKDAGNVVLFEFIKKDSVSTSSSSKDETHLVNIESIVLPDPQFAEGAIALAPFPLPKISAKVSQAWLFKTGMGDIATLPVVMFHLHNAEARKILLSMISRESSENDLVVKIQVLEASEKTDTQTLIRLYYRLLQSQPALVDLLKKQLASDALVLSAELKQKVSALIAVYSGGNSRYLNFYGPRHTIKTISYYQVLAQSEEGVLPDFKDKVVFVGFSEKHETESKDDFFTAYSDSSTKLISGVEIAATLFSNLLEQNSLKPTSTTVLLLVLFFWAVILVNLLHQSTPLFVVPLALILTAVYLVIAFYLFKVYATFLPLIIPLTIQMPIAVLMIILWKLYLIRREKLNISTAFEYHLPASVVASLASDISQLKTREQLMHGICLVTDAGQYTTLSETMSPVSLRLLMNDYYEALFAPVKNQKGTVSNIVGDAMLAIWAARDPDTDLQQSACLAALDIRQASLNFNQQHKLNLPTRIGLHCGDVVLGHVGAGSHYEYRVVGDIVNTASRLEGLNKTLGTDVLASREVVGNLDNIVSCELGRFLLVGKSRPINVFQVQGLKTDTPPEIIQGNQLFQKGLNLFYAEKWLAALTCFVAINQHNSIYQAANFYMELCQRKLGSNSTLSSDFAMILPYGIIKINKK